MTKKSVLGLIAAAVAAVAAAQTSGGFRFDGPRSRVISPNGDGINDVAVICFDNPSDSEVSARVYTLLGALVADLQSKQAAAANECPPGNSFLPKEQRLSWDPRSQGAVRSGVYVYQLQAEGLSFTGTLLVVR